MSYTDSNRQFSSVGSTHDNFTTTMSPVSTPRSLQELEIINEGHIIESENMAESNFTESTAVMEYRIRLVEDVKLLTGENEMTVSEVLLLKFTESH